MSLYHFFSTIFPHTLEQDEFLLLVIKDRPTGRLAKVLVRDAGELAVFAEELRQEPEYELFFGLATWRGLEPCRAMAAWVGQPSRQPAAGGIALEYPRGVLCCWPLPEPVRCDSRLRAMNRALVERYGGIPEFSDMRAMAAVPYALELVGMGELEPTRRVVQ